MTDTARFPRGARVRLTRRWRPDLVARGDAANITLEGTVASWKPVDGGGYLHLTGVPTDLEGGWAAPSTDSSQTTTLELTEEFKP